MFRVITISREYGSGGAEVAGALAKRLGWKLVDRWLVAEVAQRAHVDAATAARLDESADPWFYHLVKALWRGGYEGVASRVETEAMDSQNMAELTGEVLLEAAALGECVIVGRGGQCLLRARKDILHTRVYAPRGERIERLNQRLAPGSDIEKALEETDHRRAAYIRRIFQEEWNDPLLYQVMISTTLGINPVAAAILSASGLTARDS